MNILIIPEDFRNDQYILKPLFEALLSDAGKPRARVTVCKDPLLAGVTEALKKDRLDEVLDRYPMADLFVLCVDRDGEAHRKTKLNELEKHYGAKVIFLAENAWEELETWALAGLKLPASWAWATVRSAISVKEDYFHPLAVARGVDDGPGRGRKALGVEAAKRLDAIKMKCPEDFGALAERISGTIKRL